MIIWNSGILEIPFLHINVLKRSLIRLKLYYDSKKGNGKISSVVYNAILSHQIFCDYNVHIFPYLVFILNNLIRIFQSNPIYVTAMSFNQVTTT